MTNEVCTFAAPLAKRTARAAVMSLVTLSLLMGLGCGGSGSNATNAPITPSANVFREDFNGTTLDSSVWQVAGWAEHGGQTSPERCYAKDGFLTMEFKNDSAYYAAHQLYLSSALQTRATFLYGRWEARLKPSSVSGVLNSFYTIDWGNGNGTKQEIDIEFLTKSFGSGAGEVHYAVHAEGKTSFNTNPDVPLPFDPSADFHIYGIEITPTEIKWTVDGTLMKTYTYSPSGVTITAPYQLKLNAWSQTNWIGGPPVANTVCTYLIDWIQFTPRAQ
ncbi:MAG: glycoside hydrolase family 16 protein [Holophaga sp.]|nr:glycoside hydrolase family 16 protein [Holophaga sp.]